jgi:hypothetical protein
MYSQLLSYIASIPMGGALQPFIIHHSFKQEPFAYIPSAPDEASYFERRSSQPASLEHGRL